MTQRSGTARRSSRYLGWLLGLTIAALQGCDQPCASTSECSAGDVCVAALCKAVACERAIFATDPQSGQCVALSGCFLTEAQRSWQTCDQDPCQGRNEQSCLEDVRCQPAYHSPDIAALFPGSRTEFSSAGCGGDAVATPGDPQGKDPVEAPGVNNGTTPKHPAGLSPCTGSQRQFVGCRSVPQIAPQRACELLNLTECQTRTDCSALGSGSGSGGSAVPVSDPFGKAPAPVCVTAIQRQTTCAGADALSCLLNASCRPVGSRCYCPPGSDCSCLDGSFLACENSDRLRRCTSDAECGTSERCDNDEACSMPRTFAALPPMTPQPGTSDCLGSCVPKGCQGLGEQRCNDDASCDGGRYGTVCRPKSYCISSEVEIFSSDAGRGNQCGCDTEFSGCDVQAPIDQLRPDRSLLVRDPEIVDDPAFSLESVFTKLAPAGQGDAFAKSLLSQVGLATVLSNGATSGLRAGFDSFARTELLPNQAGVLQRFSKLMATTALINRLDLAAVGSCGEARLSFALTEAYTNGNKRMTLIVELRVPDDGMGCKLVAQRWAELSAIDDVTQRRTRLLALYAELLKPANLGQLRTNEFLNLSGGDPWELREFHLRPDGLLQLVPVAQTIDAKHTGTAELTTWVRDNAAALGAGTAVVPARLLAAVSTENGGRISLMGSADTVVRASEKAVNELACAGCHLTETKSPFVHIGERLGKRVGTTYVPAGRAVIDDFLQKELVKRAATLQRVLNAPQSLLSHDWRPVVQTRTH